MKKFLCMLLVLLLVITPALAITSVPGTFHSSITYDESWQELLRYIAGPVDLDKLLPGAWQMRLAFVAYIEPQEYEWYFGRAYDYAAAALLISPDTSELYCLEGLIDDRSIFLDCTQISEGLYYIFLFQNIPSIDFNLKF